MTRKLSKASKAADYNRLRAERDKYRLAVYDFANHKWSVARTYTPKTIREQFEYEYDGSAITVACSWRSMPLFYVRQLLGDRIDAEVYGESEIQDMYRVNPRSTYVRVMYQAMLSFTADHTQKREVTEKPIELTANVPDYLRPLLREVSSTEDR